MPIPEKPIQENPSSFEQLDILLILENQELRKQKEELMELSFEIAIKNAKIKIKEMRHGEDEDKTIAKLEEKF